MKSGYRMGCTLCVFVTAFTICAMVTYLAEMLHDGLARESHTFFAEIFMAIAPPDLFLLITPTALSAAYFVALRNSEVNFHHLTFGCLVTAMALIGLAVVLEVARHFVYMDGHRAATPCMWIFHSLLSGSLLWFAVKALRSSKDRNRKGKLS